MERPDSSQNFVKNRLRFERFYSPINVPAHAGQAFLPRVSESIVRISPQSGQGIV